MYGDVSAIKMTGLVSVSALALSSNTSLFFLCAFCFLLFMPQLITISLKMVARSASLYLRSQSRLKDTVQ
jgi:hypothetical protein